jgi:hypothetical protein
MLEALSFVVGILGLGAWIFAFMDNRRERNARVKAIIAAHRAIERAYGLLIGIKAHDPALTDAINDGIKAINDERAKLDGLVDSLSNWSWMS